MKLGSVESQQDPALLLSCSPAGAVPTLQDGLALGRWSLKLTSCIAEFPACSAGLVHCVCLPLGLLLHAFSPGEHAECSSGGSD